MFNFPTWFYLNVFYFTIPLLIILPYVFSREILEYSRCSMLNSTYYQNEVRVQNRVYSFLHLHVDISSEKPCLYKQ